MFENRSVRMQIRDQPTLTCSSDYHVLELPAQERRPLQSDVVQFHLSRFPAAAHVIGIARPGCDTYVTFVLCLFLACIVGVHTSRYANSAKFNPSASNVCPRRCTCLLGSSSRAGINATCSDLGLTEVPQPIGMDIEVLDLSGNWFSDISDGHFRGGRLLRVLNLANNRLRSVGGGTFTGLVRLTHLYLHHNLLSSLHLDVLNDVPQLIHLDLSHNRLRNLEFDSLVSPEHPGCNSGPVKRIRYLDLSHNPNLGRNMRSDVFCFRQLRYLALKDTGLFKLDVIVNNLRTNDTQSLEYLDISTNRITVLTTEQLSVFLQKVRILDLSGNSFLCDCSIFPIITWLETHRSSVVKDWILPSCRFPGKTPDVPLVSLSTDRVKAGCDVAAKCRFREHFVADHDFDPDQCPPEVQPITDLKVFTAARTTTRPLIAYDSIRTTYDPMLGWYTAMALMSMVLGLILCIVFDKIKKKYQDYRYRMWEEKVYETMGELPPEVQTHNEADPMPVLRRWDTSEYSSTIDVISPVNVGVMDKVNSDQLKCSLVPTDLCNNVHPKSRLISLSRASLIRQASSTESSEQRNCVNPDSVTNLTRSDCTGRCTHVNCRNRAMKSSRGILERSQSEAVDRRSPQLTHSPGSSRPELSRSSSAASDPHARIPTGRRPATHQHNIHHRRHHHQHQRGGASHPAGRRTMRRAHSTATGRPAGSKYDGANLSRKPPMARSASTASSGCLAKNSKTGVNQSLPRMDSVERPTSGAKPDIMRTKLARNNSLADNRRCNYSRLRSESRSPPKSNRPTALELIVNTQNSTPAGVHGTNINLTNSHTAWDTLAQVMRELKVAEVNPDCPLHNRRNYQKLKLLIQSNPDLSLNALLEELKMKC
ncbi:hypothetical protein LSH36_460g01000 [Paralvinella palmiformis]|uniref:LRRCT domain-containing protein n=1 Tax=Paralvinella palmiformis TaxID=53620 RepID=A0AAD9MZZ1_9ANNE|nr:hypothetical protein LSH36_460g01000 [Paralvinella palmiformis]